MAFLGGFGEKVSKAAQAAAKKSNELVEITKINMSISGEEDKIQKVYKQIGQYVFDNFKDNSDADENIAGLCQQIMSHQKNISDLKEKLMAIKNIRQCADCGAEIELSTSFCPKCGSKQEAPEAPAAEDSQKPVCPSCNAEYDEGTVFCSNCGHKIAD